MTENSENKSERPQQRRHPQLLRQMEQDEITFVQPSTSEKEYSGSWKTPEQHGHDSHSVGTNRYETEHATSDKPTCSSSIESDKQQQQQQQQPPHINRHHLPPTQDSRTSSSTGSGATGGTSAGSQSSGSKQGSGSGSGSGSSGKPRLGGSGALSRGTRCSSSASSSTEETEAREKRFGSVDLHPLPSVALTAMMNQAMRRSLYTESSIQNTEQIQYATLLAAHKSYADSSGQIDVQLNTASVPQSKNDLVSLLSQTATRNNSNSPESSLSNTTGQMDTPQFNQNVLLQLFPPNLLSRLICPVHADSLLAQLSQTLSMRNNNNNNVTKNEQITGNMTSLRTVSDDNGDINANSMRQSTNTPTPSTIPTTTTTTPTTPTAALSATGIISSMPPVQYPASMTESNATTANMISSTGNNNQSSGPQRIGPYYLGPTLGRGNFAVVKLGKHSQLAVKVAIKIMNKDLIGSKNLGKVSRELEAMKRCQHPHIIRLYHVMETESNIFMVTEYASKGEVFDHISLSHAFTEKEARELFWQIVCAIEFCHNSGIVHRDLKAENLLLDSDFKIKVADFGFCNFFQNDQLLSTHCGSPQYAAPELFKGEPYDGTLADVWSLGVILYILVCGSFPFPGESLGDIRTQVLRGLVRFPFYLSTACEQVIRCMLQVDPIRRFKLKQVMTTAWMLESPNVEHYKSLMNKYQIHAKERQFDILFHHQHPEHSKIAKEEYLERIERKLDIGIIKALSSEAGLDEEQIRQSTIQRKYDRHHAAYELLKDKIKFFYHNPILRRFVNDELQKEMNKPCTTTQRQNQNPSWQSTSSVIPGCRSRGEQMPSSTPSTQLATVPDVLDETMSEGQMPSADIHMSSDSSDISDVQMKDNSSVPDSSIDTTPVATTDATTALLSSSSNIPGNTYVKDDKQNDGNVSGKKQKEGSLKEWKSASQPKNTELNAAIHVLKADEDEILSHFGIDPSPMTKSSFSNSTRRHTLQFATSLFHKPSHHRDNADSIMTANNGDDDDDGDDNDVDGDKDGGGSRQPVQPSTTSATTDTTSRGMSDPAANKIHEQSDVDNKNTNKNQVNTPTEGNSTKRSTVRRFPRQITQPHPNRLQYNQNNAENSDQMLRNRLDWMPNTWETTQSEFKKPLMIQSQRPYLNKISKQNDQTLTSLELGQEAATTRMPAMENTTASTTSQPPGETTQDGSVTRRNDLPILIDPMKQTTESETMQIIENIPVDYNMNIPLNTLNISSSKSEYPKNPIECSYMPTSRSQLVPSQLTNLQSNPRDALLDRIPEQISVDMNADPNKPMTTTTTDNTAHIPIEKSSVLEEPCWSAAHDEDEDDNACDPAAGVLRTLLPQLNLPANLPAMIHQPVACFTVKDPNLLAPPEFMTPHSSSFPRRSSDGAADLQPLHRPVITVGGSYPEQANYRKESSGAESENSSLAVINPVRASRPESTEAASPSVNLPNLSDWVRTSRPMYDKIPSTDYDPLKPSVSLSSSSSSAFATVATTTPTTPGQQTHESRSRSLAAQQRSLFTALHSHRRRLPLGLWWKLTHKKFNQTGEEFRNELWKAQFIRHQKRFSLPVNCGPVRRPSDTVKTELQCRCHQPLTPELLQEIQRKLRDTSWIQKLNNTESAEVKCSTISTSTAENVPEIYRRGSEASQLTAWEQRLRQYSDLYNPGTHTPITSTFHQPVPQIETDDDVDEEGKLNSLYPYFSSQYTDEMLITSAEGQDMMNLPANTIAEPITVTTANTSPKQHVQYNTQFLLDSVREDNSLLPGWNESSYEPHMTTNTANVSPISQSGIELTDLKTELHKLEVESNTMQSTLPSVRLQSSTDSSKSIDDYGIHKLNASTNLPKFLLPSATSNIPSFLSDQAINLQQSTLPIKHAHVPNEQSPSTSSSVYWSHRAFENNNNNYNANSVHRRASSVVGAPIESNYLLPDRDMLEKPEDTIRRHRHSVGETFDDKMSSFDYEYCSNIHPSVFNVSSEFQSSTIPRDVNLNSEMINISLHDRMSIKSLSSFSTATSPGNNSNSNSGNNNNTGIGQRLFDRLHPERTNYLHMLQHPGGSLDRRLNPDFLRSPRRKIYQEWLPKLTELSRKAFDAAKDRMNKVKPTNTPQSLVRNFVHSDILYPSTTSGCYSTTSKTDSLRDDANCSMSSDTINMPFPSPSLSQTEPMKEDQQHIHTDHKDVIESVDIDPESNIIDQDVDEEDDDEKDCALAPLQTHMLSTNVQSMHYSSRPRHRAINQGVGQNLTYPQQVMPFFHGNLLNQTGLQQYQQHHQQQQHQATCLNQLPSTSNPIAGGYAFQDLVDFSNPQALPAAAAAASLLLFRSTDDDDDLAAIDRVNQRIALGRLTGNFSDTEYPNLIGGTLPPPPTIQLPQQQQQEQMQSLRSLPISQPILQTPLSNPTMMNRMNVLNRRNNLPYQQQQQQQQQQQGHLNQQSSGIIPHHQQTLTERNEGTGESAVSQTSPSNVYSNLQSSS
ncbi:unnamed protein product [Trichobilharzia szidati]|nr:unnamed protein product [Trichobilharzia szidati]